MLIFKTSLTVWEADYSSESGIRRLPIFSLRHDVHLGVVTHAYYIRTDVLVDLSLNLGIHMARTILVGSILQVLNLRGGPNCF